MDFSIFMIVMGKGRQSDEDAYDQALEDLVLAERLGFDIFWFAEHHFNDDFSLSPSPNLLAAAGARLTQHIRIGIAVNVLPQHHPLRLAEEGAMLDCLSKGRLEFGIGRGIAGPEIAPWGIAPGETRPRFEECHDFLLQAWEKGEAQWQGRFFTVENTPLVPNVLQRPHPPIWVSAQSPDSVAWCAARDYPAMQVAEPLSVGVEQVQRYKDFAAQAGVTPKRGGIVPLRYVFVAETDAQARRASLPYMQDFWDHFTKIASHALPQIGPDGVDGYDYWRGAGNLEQWADLSYEGLNEAGIIITGSPDTVIEAVRRQQELLECDHLICDFWRGAGSDAAARRRSMELFATEVMPAFR